MQQQRQQELVHARALRADILAAPNVWLPRREILLEWLDGFLQRAAAARYELEPTEASDLEALDQFLRTQKVPVA
jgi:hypothetical protein